jgi:hypothetical protein
MKRRFLGMMGMAAAIALGTIPSLSGQSPTTAAQKGPAPKTVWGEPDLQGVWTYESQIPLQRPARYAGKEFFTDAEIAELDKQRAALL